jgi:hypothetical protein
MTFSLLPRHDYFHSEQEDGCCYKYLVFEQSRPRPRRGNPK